MKMFYKRLVIVLGLAPFMVPLLCSMELEQGEKTPLVHKKSIDLQARKLNLLVQYFRRIKKLPPEIIGEICKYLPPDDPALMSLLNYTGLKGYQALELVKKYVHAHQKSPVDAFKDYTHIYYPIKCAWKAYTDEIEQHARAIAACKDADSVRTYITNALPMLVLTQALDDTWSAQQLNRLRSYIRYTLYCLKKCKSASHNGCHERLIGGSFCFNFCAGLYSTMLVGCIIWIIIYYAMQYNYSDCFLDITDNCVGACSFDPPCSALYQPCNNISAITHMAELQTCCTVLGSTNCSENRREFNHRLRNPQAQLKAWAPVLATFSSYLLLCCAYGCSVHIAQPTYTTAQEVTQFLKKTITHLELVLTTLENRLRHLGQV